jgi:hypothetical protein
MSCAGLLALPLRPLGCHAAAFICWPGLDDRTKSRLQKVPRVFQTAYGEAAYKKYVNDRVGTDRDFLDPSLSLWMRSCLTRDPTAWC